MIAAISALCDFEPMVFTSRCISWTRKSSLRPAGSAPSSSARAWARWLRRRVTSSEPPRPGAGEVAPQAGDLLGDVRPIREQRDLLRQARGVEGNPARQLLDPLGEAGPMV